MKILKFILAALCLSWSLQGCGVRPSSVDTTAPGVPLKELCDRYNVMWQWDGVTQVVMLEHKGNKAKALVGSNVVLLGKDKITLDAPLRRQNSTIYVPSDFESKVLAPFGISSSTVRTVGSLSRVRTVVVDAGHGGKDPGAKGPGGVLEKEVTLDISKRLKKILEESGMKVIMTRESDTYPTLPKRTEMATKSDADIFVSVHANSNPKRDVHGLEVFYVKTYKKADLNEEQRLKNEKAYVTYLDAVKNSSTIKIVADMMYNIKVAESARLAREIALATTKQTQALNRGASPCRFFVVRNTLIPAVLVEVGFLTNRKEEQKLKSSSHRQKVAEGIARGILNYAGE